MSESTLLSYSVIVMAVQGDSQAMKKAVEHYTSYTITLALREIVDENGKITQIVNDEWKRRLELKLITVVIKFKLR